MIDRDQQNLDNEQAEEIILASSDAHYSEIDPPSLDDRNASVEITSQGTNHKETLRYRLINGFFVETCYLRKNDAPTTLIYHVGFLSPKAKKRPIVNKWLLWFCILTLCIGMNSFYWVNEALTRYALLAVSLIGLFGLLRSVHWQTYYTSKHGQAPIVYINHVDLPGQERRKFTKSLSKSIKQHPLPEDLNQLAAETKLLRELQEKQFIKQQDYETYRDKILTKHNAKK